MDALSVIPGAERFATLGFPLQLRPERVAASRRYAELHYNSALRPGQGVEEIAAHLGRLDRGGRWLDLGAGPTTLFWSLCFERVESIVANDISPEALAVLAEFATGDDQPRCYAEVGRLLGRGESALEERRQLLRELLVFDAFAPWPDALAGREFDQITSLGAFGLAPDPGTYAGAFRHIADHLCAGGVALGANWVRSPSLARRTGRGNAWLDVRTVQAGAIAGGLELLFAEHVPIAADPDYSHVIVWGMRR